MRQESDSKYLILWLCVFLTAGIIFVGWFVSLSHNFKATNAEMNNNVKSTFEEAQQEVWDSFDQLQKVIEEMSVDDQVANQTILDDSVDSKVEEIEKLDEGEVEDKD